MKFIIITSRSQLFGISVKRWIYVIAGMMYAR